MGRKHKRTPPDWWIPADQFRKVREWLNQAVLAKVITYAGDGIEGDTLGLTPDDTDDPENWSHR